VAQLFNKYYCQTVPSTKVRKGEYGKQIKIMGLYQLRIRRFRDYYNFDDQSDLPLCILSWHGLFYLL